MFSSLAPLININSVIELWMWLRLLNFYQYLTSKYQALWWSKSSASAKTLWLNCLLSGTLVGKLWGPVVACWTQFLWLITQMYVISGQLLETCVFLKPLCCAALTLFNPYHVYRHVLVPLLVVLLAARYAVTVNWCFFFAMCFISNW